MRHGGVVSYVTCKPKKTKVLRIKDMNNYEIDYINSKLIELNNFVFADPHLPFGAIRDASTHCTHLQIAQAGAQTKICKRVQFKPSLKELYRAGIHGIEHAFRVLKLVQKLSELEKVSKEQKHLLEFCAIFHDIGRIDDDIDDYHGVRSIKNLKNYNYFGLKSFNNPIVKFIVENHCISDDIAFNNVFRYRVNNYENALFLLKLFKDADNLDRVRLGDFDKKYLRNQKSNKIIEYAIQLYQESFSVLN